jgi:HEAT repeat protein
VGAQQPVPPKPTYKPPQMDPGAKTTADNGPGAVVKSGREALTAGRLEQAIDLAERVLLRLPTFADASALKIDALFAARKPEQAIATYDEFFKANGREDPAVLAHVARGVLRQIGDTTDLAAPMALGALAAAGDAPARAALVKMSTSRDGVGGDVLAREALARLGDANAISALVTQAASESPNTSASALKTIGELREARGKPAVMKVLNAPHSNPLVQLTAVTAAGRLNMTEAKPALLKALKEGPYIIRLQSAIALHEIGDTTGDQMLTEGLNAEFPDARLAVAQALAHPAATARPGSSQSAAGVGGSDQAWIASVKPLLSNRDALYRFSAAELLLPTDRSAALDVLKEGAVDKNPVIRNEVARIMAADAKADLAAIRPFLKDPSGWARVYAAQRLIKTASPAAK